MPADPSLRWALIVILIRFVGIGLLALSLFFSIINPVLGIVLILALGFGTNIVLRFLVKASFRNIASYLVYVGTLFGLGGLWFFSIITTVEAAIILVIIAFAYLVLSFWRVGSWRR